MNMDKVLERASCALVAMLAFAALAASSASAETTTPEFTVAPGAVKGTVETTLFGGFGAKWSYSAGSFSAEGPGKAGLSGVALTLREGNSGACINSEHKSFATSSLKARLGYINKAKAEVGLMLQPTAKVFGLCQSFKGEEVNWQYTGVVTGRIAPVNTKTKKFTVTFKVIAGRQELLYFEGEKLSSEVFPLKLSTGAVTVEGTVSLETGAETEIVA
jgi:hypothetical protein